MKSGRVGASLVPMLVPVLATAFFAMGAQAMDIKGLWNFADPAASEAVFRERLASASGDCALSLQTQIARSLGLRSRFDEAHAVLDQIEPRLAGAGAEPRVRYLLERGRTFRSSRQVDRARPLFAQAVEAAAAAGLDDLSVDAGQQHRHDEALDILRRLDREAAAAREADGFVFEELAENLLAVGQAAPARPYFAQAHAALFADSSPDRVDDARLARLLALSK